MANNTHNFDLTKHGNTVADFFNPQDNPKNPGFGTEHSANMLQPVAKILEKTRVCPACKGSGSVVVNGEIVSCGGCGTDGFC